MDHLKRLANTEGVIVALEDVEGRVRAMPSEGMFVDQDQVRMFKACVAILEFASEYGWSDLTVKELPMALVVHRVGNTTLGVFTEHCHPVRKSLRRTLRRVFKRLLGVELKDPPRKKPEEVRRTGVTLRPVPQPTEWTTGRN